MQKFTKEELIDILEREGGGWYSLKECPFCSARAYLTVKDNKANNGKIFFYECCNCHGKSGYVFLNEDNYIGIYGDDQVEESYAVFNLRVTIDKAVRKWTLRGGE